MYSQSEIIRWLLEKNYEGNFMYDDVKILKLIDGETIIARVKKEEDFYLLKKGTISF